MRSINDMAIRRSIYFLSILFLLFYLTGCQHAPTSSGGGGSGPADLFSQKITGDYDGCGIGVFIANPATLMSAEVDLYESKISREVSVVMWFIDFADGPTSLSTLRATCDMVKKRGSIPMITWMPYSWYNPVSNPGYNPKCLVGILNGEYDSYINSFAANAISYGKPMFIRFGHEMNGNWYPWNASYYNNDATTYKNAWIYVHDKFSAAGASNVNWVWCANHVTTPGDPWNQPEEYYPGDQYVDWIGFDGYAGNYDPETDPTQIFKIYSDLANAHPHKPMMIGEMACGTADAGASRSEWISNLFDDIKSKYPNIKLYVWFNINKAYQGGFESDWTVDASGSSPVNLASFEAAMNDPYYYSSIFPPSFEPYPAP